MRKAGAEQLVRSILPKNFTFTLPSAHLEWWLQFKTHTFVDCKVKRGGRRVTRRISQIVVGSSATSATSTVPPG